MAPRSALLVGIPFGQHTQGSHVYQAALDQKLTEFRHDLDIKRIELHNEQHILYERRLELTVILKDSRHHPVGMSGLELNVQNIIRRHEIVTQILLSEIASSVELIGRCKVRILAMEEMRGRGALRAPLG